MSTDAYPLAWPDGWPRTPYDKQGIGASKFPRPWPNGPWTFAEARDALFRQIELITHRPAVISSNFPVSKQVGLTEGKRRPEDQGIAIYFERKGRPYVMACDRFRDAEGNMRSLALALEAMRQLERHGGGAMMEKAFEGFVALPAPKRPHEILGIPADATEADVKRAWRLRIADAHPDQGGTQAAAAEINAARDAMLKQIGA